jgi:8-oxo-dGTP diphosphatase
VSYLARGLPKQVDYWAATTTDTARPSHEVDDIAWLPLGPAADRLSYEHDREVLAALVPRETVPLIIVRHASAGPKGADDLHRPLDGKGEKDAATLAGLLACFAPRARVLSSPALRCTATVLPYASAAGVKIEEDPDLITVGGTTPEPLIRDLVQAAQPAVVCLHRENLPVAVEAACAALGAEPPPDSALPKGAFWVLHAATGTLAAMERHSA